MSRLGRAMADPSRVRILLRLLEAPTYPRLLASDLGLTRANVSNHLACLRGCGLVVGDSEGRQVRYRIADPHLTHALESLLQVALAVDVGEPCRTPMCDVPGCCTGDAGVVAQAAPRLTVHA